MFKKKTFHINFLIVDDNSSVLKILEKIIDHIFKDLENIQYTLYQYKDYKTFLQSNKTSFDVAIIDWNLPDCKGSKIIENIKNTTKRLAIFTGQTDDNIEISQFCLTNKIAYIPKGSKITNIKDYINKQIFRFIQDK